MAFSSHLIIGSTFNSAQGDLHIHNTSRDSEYGLRDLKQGVSLGAIHDSAERYPAPNCHPDTRKAVRKIILDWIHSESWASLSFWLYGPAGAGKTAILQAIAELLCDPSESYQNFGASFFFSRGKKGRDEGHFLFPTIAYQLALKVPGLRRHVNDIMEKNPTLHTKSMAAQLQHLIVDAFDCLSPPPQCSYLVIIDGLDECQDKATQQLILQLLCKAITIHKLPLRFLIGSRPESHIRDIFDQESLYKVTRRVVLDEMFDPGRDIQVFLQDGFAKICAKNSILSHVEQPWPEEGVIDLLVQRSSGQFIYAATVLKFVGADFLSPTQQLALVLKPDPTAFSDLDQLYTQILSVYPSAVNIVQVLGFIIGFDRSLPDVIEDILEMEEGGLKLVLRGLSSLLEDENQQQPTNRKDKALQQALYRCGLEKYVIHPVSAISSTTLYDENGESLNKEVIPYVIPHFAHASFSDYLFNSSRSGPFHVNRQEYEYQVTIRSFALITKLIRSWWTSSITRSLRTRTWVFFTSRLPDRFSRSPKVVKEAIITDINDLVQDFWRSSSDGPIGASFFALRRLFEILHGCFNNLETLSNLNLRRYSACSTQSDLDYQIRAKFKTMFFGYRKMFDQSFPKSKDLGDMIRFLPGVVVQKPMGIQGMADLYRIKPDLLERLIKSAIEPLGLSYASPYPRYMLDGYLSGFLQDRDRSRHYYCDPILQHISICRLFLSLLDGFNAFDFQSYDLCGYVHSHLNGHLCAATTGFLYAQNISDDPAVEILHDLEKTSFVDENLSDRLVRHIIQVILRWANIMNYRLKGVADVVSNVDLMERMCHLTNKIYREILYLTRHHDERMTHITIRGLDHVPVDAFSRIPEYRIVLSYDLLGWITVEGRIPCSFTTFITTPELSGPFYISPGIYHTQITEYSLETIFLRNYSRPSPFSLYNCTLNPDWSFGEHLSLALPTEMIFYLLRSVHSECLIRDYSTESMLDILEIIIKWLQGLGSERPSDLYDRFQDELLRLPQSSSPLSDL